MHILSALLFALSTPLQAATIPAVVPSPPLTLDNTTEASAAAESSSLLVARKVHFHDAPSAKANALECGIFPAADKWDANNLVLELGGKLAAHRFVIGPAGPKAPRCQRVHCWNTSGVYVCNDDTKSLTLTGTQIHSLAALVNTQCCTSLESANNKAKAGVQFSPNGEFNVVIGYANCRNSPDQNPSQVGGGQINGDQCR